MSEERSLHGKTWDMSRRLAALTMLGLGAGIVALDQWTKQLAVTHLLDSGVRSVPALGP